MPVMQKLNKDAVKNSARAIKLISKDEHELSKAAREISACFIGENFLPIELCELGDAYLSRVIIEKCEEFVKNQKQVLDFSDICDIIALMRQEKTTGTVIISKDLRVHRAQNKIYFSRGAQKISEVKLSKGESICISGYKITCNDGEITVRARRDGDKIKLKGRRTRLLKKILCDAKIPEFLRDSIPVIEKEGKLIAVCGFGFADGDNSGGATIEVNA